MSGTSTHQYAVSEGVPASLQQQVPSAESLAIGLNAWKWAAFDANRPFCAPWTVLPPFLPPQDASASQQAPAAPSELSSLLSEDQPASSADPSSTAGPQNGWSHPSPAQPQSMPMPASLPQPSASFALAVGTNGEVSYTASGALNDPCRYPHFVAAREYLAGALRLDAAALALRARMEDPAVAAALDCKPDLLLGAMAHPHLAMGGPHFAAQLAAAARGVGMPSSALAGSTSSAGKALAYSKLVRKASRGVFKRVIRKMLQTPDGSLPLCTSNRCIIPSPEESPPLLDMHVHHEGLPPTTAGPSSSAVAVGTPVDSFGGHISAAPAAPASLLFPPSNPHSSMAPIPASQGYPVGQRPFCAAGGACAPTRAALDWPDDLPCVDPSKVSIPVDKAIGLMEWVQSLGHDVPELGELQGLKKRPSADTETKRNVKPRAAHGGMHRGADGTSGDAADDDAVAGLAALRAAPMDDE